MADPLLSLPARVVVAAALCLVVLTVRAGEHIAVVVNGDATPHAEFIASLKHSLADEAGVAKGWTLQVSDAVPQPDTPDDPIGIIAVGAEAAQAVAEANPPQPVLYGLIPGSLADKVLAKGRGPRAAVVLDQPPARRFALIAALLPNARRVAILYGPVSRAQRAALEAEASRHGFSVNAREVSLAEELHRALARVLRGADVLLAVPDPVVYGRDVARNVLLDTYRARVPLIGYSSAWVAAGALAAIYATPSDLGAEAAEVTRAMLGTGGSAAGGVHEPRQFQIGISPQVARSLGIPVPTEAAVRRRIEKESER
jgi:ABC-type uncharacterized transport system substrate-binding protein